MLGPARCTSPVREVAEKLLEYSRRNALVSDGTGNDATAAVRRAVNDLSLKTSEISDNAERAAGDGESTVPGAEADEQDERTRALQRATLGRGRRAVVFSEPVRVDADFTPPVHSKSPSEAAELGNVLARHILFGSAPEEARTVIVGAMERRTYKVGDVIIKQGDPGDFYYVLASGSADISLEGRGVVLTVRQGGGFGELALLYDAPRAATIVAAEDVTAWALDRMTFKQVLIGATMRKRELYGSFLHGVPILSTLTHEEVLTIADALLPVTVEAGTVVVAQGDPAADRFYIVEDGELKAEIEGVPGEVCARLTRGAYFGERALITDAPRAATITAVADSHLLAMDRASFLRLLGPITDLLSRKMDVYERYARAPPTAMTTTTTTMPTVAT